MPVRRQVSRHLLHQFLRIVINANDETLHSLAVVIEMGHEVGSCRFISEFISGEEVTLFFAMSDPTTHGVDTGILDFPPRLPPLLSGMNGQVIEISHDAPFSMSILQALLLSIVPSFMSSHCATA